MHPVISIEGLKKSFKAVSVLNGIDLSVEQGSMLALLGPNGAGKTTTVKILSTLIRPDAGVVMVNGYDVVRQADEVRHSIGLTGQYAAIDELLTGRDNLVMMGRLYHLSGSESKRRAQELLEQFGLEEAADRLAKQYSGGMRRRLDLAASLVATPPIVFLDEPTTVLDPRSRLSMWEVIKELQRKGVTILLTTQYLEEADKLADQIAVLDRGTIIARGTADELKGMVGSERIEIVVRTEALFAKATRLLPAQGAISDVGERRLSLPTDGSVREVKRLLDLLEKESIEIETLSMQKPSLDDVFMHLTGHETTRDEKEEGSTAGMTASTK
jgi:ABC-2 type transport system ATP-binding protein